MQLKKKLQHTLTHRVLALAVARVGHHCCQELVHVHVALAIQVTRSNQAL